MIPRLEDYKAWWEDAVADRERLEAEVAWLRADADMGVYVERIEAAEAEVERLRGMIVAEHSYKASLAGAACTCEICMPGGDPE